MASSNTVRNLGVIFDQHMPFSVHIKQISRAVFFDLINSAIIKNFLPFQSDAEN